jgi:uncharacterized protein YegP (UPF0339 family)
METPSITTKNKVNAHELAKQLGAGEPIPSPPPTVQNVQTPQEVSPAADDDNAPKRAAYIEMAQDEAGDWHWCLWSANGRAIAANVQPFKRRNDCQKNVETALELFRDQRLRIVATVGG